MDSKAITQFFQSQAFGVVGASSRRHKFGNKVLRCYQQHKKEVYPVNPNEENIEGLKSVKTITELPATVKSISIITPPAISEKIIPQAIQHGISSVWFQPGAESKLAVEQCRKAGINVIAGGPCILVELGFMDV